MNKEEFLKDLIDKSHKINVAIDKKCAEKFYNYMSLLLEWNEKINLTAITDEREIILKHFIDSITINSYIEKSKSVLDIGTGAGFPGIPLKILNDDKQFLLVDSLNKRIQFLNDVCDKLDLYNIECLHVRAEELAKNREYREMFDVTVSRAVAKLNVLLEYMLPFVNVGGTCICMKGPNVTDELKEAENAVNVLGGKIEKIKTFVLPDTDMERNIVIIKKIRNTPGKFPRKAGIPLKQPII